MSIPQPEPKRDPRPIEDGTYRCYHEDCANEAEIARKRSIESTEYDPVVVTITVCGQCHLAYETMRVTRMPLDTSMAHYEIEDKDHLPDDVREEIEAVDESGWHDERLYPRLLANAVLYGNPDGPDDRPGGVFEHAGPTGERIRDLFETPLDEQLTEYGISAPKELGR